MFRWLYFVILFLLFNQLLMKPIKRWRSQMTTDFSIFFCLFFFLLSRLESILIFKYGITYIALVSKNRIRHLWGASIYICQYLLEKHTLSLKIVQMIKKKEAVEWTNQNVNEFKIRNNSWIKKWLMIICMYNLILLKSKSQTLKKRL